MLYITKSGIIVAMSMQFPLRFVGEATYKRESGTRITPHDTALRLGWICVARQIEEDLPAGAYAYDAYARLTKLEDPDRSGQRVVGLTLVDADGKEMLFDGTPLYGEAIMGSDGFIYLEGREEGYLLGQNDPWDISRLEELGTSNLNSSSPQLVAV